MSEITMYGAEWCGDCRRSQRLLNELGVEYSYINIEEVPGAADKVVEINGGAQSIPVVMFSDGSHLTEPSDPDLRKKLESLGLIQFLADLENQIVATKYFVFNPVSTFVKRLSCQVVICSSQKYPSSTGFFC